MLGHPGYAENPNSSILQSDIFEYTASSTKADRLARKFELSLGGG
jgi:hypothetical protein